MAEHQDQSSAELERDVADARSDAERTLRTRIAAVRDELTRELGARLGPMICPSVGQGSAFFARRCGGGLIDGEARVVAAAVRETGVRRSKGTASVGACSS